VVCRRVFENLGVDWRRRRRRRRRRRSVLRGALARAMRQISHEIF
jgi:hypothetical protein